MSAVLREGTPAATATRPRQRARALLVTAQLALSLTLLIGSALMVRSLLRLLQVDPGFEDDGVLTAEIAMPFRGYEDYASVYRLWDELLTRVRGLPGVEAAGTVSGLPLVPKPGYYDLALDVEDRPGEPYAGVTVYTASPGYFEAMRIPVREGRGVAASGAMVERPVLLSASAARRLFAGGEAVGERLRRATEPGPWMTVVGIVEDVPAERVGGEPSEVVYVPILEQPVDPPRVPRQGALVVRASVAPASLAPAVRGIVRSLDPNLPVANVRTMRSIVSDSTARTTFAMLLLVIASMSALFLGVVGVFGVTSYTVGRRKQEIGLRVALGARAPDVERMVLGETGGVVLAGTALGAMAALVLTRFMAALRCDRSEPSGGNPNAAKHSPIATPTAPRNAPRRR